MDIHEYQAKKILSDFGVKIPTGGIAVSYTHLTLPTSDLV